MNKKVDPENEGGGLFWKKMNHQLRPRGPLFVQKHSCVKMDCMLSLDYNFFDFNTTQ